MDELLRLLRESLPNAIGGLITAAALALIGVIATRVLWLYRKRQRRMTNSSPNPSSGLPLLSSPEQTQELLSIKRQRLFELQKKQALKGVNTEPEILIEIEELEEEIRRLHDL